MPENVKDIKLKAAPIMEMQPVMAHLAVGKRFSTLQHIIQLDADQNAPHFDESDEPTQDGRAYRATDGSHYFRPTFVVAQREAPLSGPDVQFLKSQDGTIRLQFELEEQRPAGLPDDAVPFNVRDIQVVLDWVEGSSHKQHLFPQPTLVAWDEQQDPSKPDFFLRVSDALETSEIEAIFDAMGSNAKQAKLLLRMKYGYFVESAAEPAGNSSRDTMHVGTILPLSNLTVTNVVMATPMTAAAPKPVATPTEPVMLRVSETVNPAAVPANAAISNVSPSAIKVAFKLNADAIKAIESAANARKKSKEFREAVIRREIPFVFNQQLDQNRHIYAAITGDESMIEDWTSTPNGLVRKSTFANTVYRIPDEIRLAYSAELGAPHLLPTVYRDENEDARVRVMMRLVPWHDPKKVTALREDLEKATGGALLNPSVITGGYETATLTLTSAFPEEITSITAKELPISLETGADLTLDLSLEFYRYLAQLIVGPVGLSGEVAVALGNKAAAGSEGETTQTKRIPVRVSLGDLATLPVQLEVDSEAICPEEAQLRNLTHCPINVREHEIRLLQWDENSVAPLAVIEGMALNPEMRSGGFSIEKSTPKDIAVGPKKGTGDTFWNAIQVDLIGTQLEDGAQDCLDKIHEIAPSASLSWSILVDCPLLHKSDLPDTYQNLYRIEVRISRPGFAPKQVVLSADTPSVEVPMDRTLSELISDEAESVLSFSYAVRNVYYDHQGSWSSSKSAEGSSFFVFPNPVEGD